MKNKKLTILVSSFDGYSDIWPSFEKIFKNNWSDCEYPIKITSNFLECNGLETIKTGEEINWSTRMIKAIESIDSDYVLLLLEDYLIGKKVDSNKFDSIVNKIVKEEINYFRLTNFPKSKNSKAIEEYAPIYQDEEYGINLQAAIWKVSYLKKVLHKYSGNAWEFEIGLLSETVDAPHKAIPGCYTMLNDPLCILNGVLKGKWFPSTIKFFKKQGIIIDSSHRGMLSFLEVLKYESMQFVKNKVSSKMRKKMKKIALKLGFKFMSEY